MCALSADAKGIYGHASVRGDNRWRRAISLYSGREADGKTLVFLNGGMNTLEMWMHNPQISYVSGGHLSTVLKTDGYIRTIRSFLNTVRE